MTKPLTWVVFEKLRMLLGVCEDPGVNWRQYHQFKGGNVTKV
jgi:hypothetical protein